MTRLTAGDRALAAAAQAALERRAHWHQAALSDESQRRAWSGHRLLSTAAASHAETLAHLDPSASIGTAEIAALRLAWEAARWRDQALAATADDQVARFVAKAGQAQQRAAAVRQLRQRLDPDHVAEQRARAAEQEAKR